MAQFLGTHQAKLDSKGRISVPAPFRATLRSLREADNGALEISLILRRSHQYPCIEAWSERAFHALAGQLNRYDQFSLEHEDFATALFADAYPLDSDREGRIMLPDELVEHANISSSVVFLGIGTRFQIWEPTAAAKRREEARQRTRDQHLTLREAQTS